MLTIRAPQLKALNDYRRDSFLIHMARDLRHSYPEDTAGMNDAALHSFIGEGIEDAAKFQIEKEGAVAGFLALQIEFGRGLDLAPCRAWALQILSHPRLPGSLKVSMVRNRLDDMTRGRRIVRFENPPA